MQAEASERHGLGPRLEPWLVALAAAAVCLTFGMRGELSRDEANHLYAGQRMAEGVPPYVSIFNIKPPLPSMLCGLAVTAGRAAGWDDVFAARLLFLLLACCSVSALYVLARRLLESRTAAWLAAGTPLLLLPFVADAASGPQPKTATLLFQTMALAAMAARRWGLAGAASALAALTWQPMALYLLLATGLAWLQRPEGARHRIAPAAVLVGAALPLAAVLAYFAWHDAMTPLLEGSLLFFGGGFLQGSAASPARGVSWPLEVLLRSFETGAVPILLGLLVAPYLWARRRAAQPSLRALAERDAWAGFLLSLPLPLLWSLLDFQSADDAYVWLPYAAVGFAALVQAALETMRSTLWSTPQRGLPRLLGGALAAGLWALALGRADVRRWPGLDQQQVLAARLERAYGPGIRLVSLDAPELMVLLRKANPNRYVFVARGIDRYIEAREPGGVAGWLDGIAAFEPDLIAMGWAHGAHKTQILEWLGARYRPYPLGIWTLWVRPGDRRLR